MAIASQIRGWLYLVPVIPSYIVTIFVLYHILTNRALRTAVNNHFIIILLVDGLILELTDVVWLIYLNLNGVVLVATPQFCQAWVFIASVGFSSIPITMAWASIERHILVFHANWMATKKNRFFLHYFPLAIGILWPTVFYIVMFFIVPCQFPYYYNSRQCGRYGCVVATLRVSLLDSFANYIIPAIITVTFSVALLVRVLYTRYRARGRIDWRNYTKMAIQLLPVSVLYISLQLPPMLLYAAYACGLSRRVALDYFSDSFFFMYWVILFTPFASIASLPDPKTKFKNLFLFWRRRNAVQPVMTKITRRNVDQTVAVVPSFQPAMNEMARQNVNQTVSDLPVVQ